MSRLEIHTFEIPKSRILFFRKLLKSKKYCSFFLTINFLELLFLKNFETKFFFTSNDFFLRCGPIKICKSDIISPLEMKTFTAFLIIFEKAPLQPACTIPKFLLPRIIIGAQSAVRIPRHKSFLSVIIPSAEMIFGIFLLRKKTLLECV